MLTDVIHVRVDDGVVHLVGDGELTLAGDEPGPLTQVQLALVGKDGAIVLDKVAVVRSVVGGHDRLGHGFAGAGSQGGGQRGTNGLLLTKS